MLIRLHKRPTTEWYSCQNLFRYPEVIPQVSTCGGQNRNQYIAATICCTRLTKATLRPLIWNSWSWVLVTWKLTSSMLQSSVPENTKHVFKQNESGSFLFKWPEEKPRPYEIKTLEHSDKISLNKLVQQIIKNRKINSLIKICYAENQMVKIRKEWTPHYSV